MSQTQLCVEFICGSHPVHFWVAFCAFVNQRTHLWILKHQDLHTNSQWIGLHPPSTQATLTNRNMFLLQTILFCFKFRAVSPWNKLAHSSALAQIGNKVNKKEMNARQSIIKLNYKKKIKKNVLQYFICKWHFNYFWTQFKLFI